MVTRRIAIYVGPADQLTSLYILSFLCDRWRREGIEIVVLNDPDRPVDADVAIVHVDATHRPSAYDRLVGRFPRVINGQVRDISKRRVSGNLLTADSTYQGPVMVKTDNNTFDLPDSRSSRGKPPGRLGKLAARIRRRFLRTSVSDIRRFCSYPIFPSVADVPWHVWRDRRLVVEKFLPERQGDLYVVRSWMFFGTREVAFLKRSREPVVKRMNALENEFITDVPDVIREARPRFGFDYGKFDYVIHDGQAVLLDTNSTPGCAGQLTPRLAHIGETLAADLIAPAGVK
jgi:hypothetical protein